MHSRLRRLTRLHHCIASFVLGHHLFEHCDTEIERAAPNVINIPSHSEKDSDGQSPLAAQGLAHGPFPTSPHSSSYRAEIVYKYRYDAVFSLDFVHYFFFIP